MKSNLYEIKYGGIPVHYRFRDPSTRWRFGKYIYRSEDDQDYINVEEDMMEKGRRLYPPDSTDSFIEYCMLMPLTSKELLKYHSCIFHSVSFLYKGKAWLITAPSGIGKTTQYLNWRKTWPGEIEMINGDKPVLKLNKSREIFVHPSPWNGKENIGNSHLSGSLGGIILLEQGPYNRVEMKMPPEILLEVFMQFLVRPDTEEEINSLISLTRTLLTGYPIWKLTNIGDTKSTGMIRETINNYLESITQLQDDGLSMEEI